MADFNQLAAQMSNMDLHISGVEETSHQTAQQGTTHLLTFKYPATELIPTEATPYIETPSNIENRRVPDESSCQAHIVGTEFFAIFDVGEEKVDYCNYSSERKEYIKLLDAIEDLKTRPGRSTLKLVSYQLPPVRGGTPYMMYRFCLTTHSEGHEETVQDFSMAWDEWECIEAMARGSGWIEILVNLVTQSSERAVLEVFKTVREAYGLEAARSMHSAWAHMWRSERPKAIQSLFRSRLEPMTQADVDAVKAPGNAILLVKLPCGHQHLQQKRQLLSLSGDSCLDQTCPTCSTPILTRDDLIEVGVGDAWDVLDAYRASSSLWQRLDTLELSRDETSFNAHTLIRAWKPVHRVSTLHHSHALMLFGRRASWT